MNLAKELKKANVKDVCIFGEGALYLCYGLPGTPIRLDYTAPTDSLSELGGKRLLPTAAKVDYKFAESKDCPDVKYLDGIDIACYAVHTRDINTLVEYMLCNLKSFDGNAVRTRYAKLYSSLHGMPGTSMADVTCMIPIETYFKNVRKSNIAEYMRQRKLSYPEFCMRTPSLCAQLNCGENNLNYALARLLK